MSKTKSLAAVVGGTVAAAVILFASGNEGVSLAPYNDKLAGNIATVCFGETNVEMRRYTLNECKALLDASIADYAEAVRNLTPGFDTLTTGQKVAAIDFTYNVGINAYRNSGLRRGYVAKNFPAACDEYLKWRFTGGKDCAISANRCSGIMKRRQAERDLCRG